MGQRIAGLGLGAWLLACGIALAQPAFRTAPFESIIGGNPVAGKALADVDVDGNLDLVFPTAQSRTIAVLYGFGDGVFELQVDYDVGIQPTAVAVADVNHDNRPDLVSVDSTTNQVSVLLATGPRLFDTDNPIIFDSPLDSLVGVVAARLDADQNPDLAIVGGDQDGKVAILLGMGDGTFQVAPDGVYSIGSTPRSIAAAFVNGDNLLDLVISNRDSGTISTLINSGSGIFLAAINSPAGDAPLGVATGNFTSDTKLDVVVANRNGDSFSLLAGTGDGHFAAPVSFPAGLFPSDAVAADFDGDGHMDVAIADYLSQDVTVAYGDGKGGFPRLRSFLSDAGTTGVLAGRLNADTLPDIATFNVLESASYAVLLARPGGGFEAEETFRTIDDPTLVAVADLTGDGRPDAFVASDNDHMATVLIAKPGGGFAAHSYDAGGASNGVALADVNGDFHPDLLLAQGMNVALAIGDGAGDFGAQQTLNVGRAVSNVAVGDMNEDGIADILVSENTAQSIGIFTGKGDGTYNDVVHRTVQTGGSDQFYPLSLLVTDLDRDGHLDVIAPNFLDPDAGAMIVPTISVLYGNGQADFSQRLALASTRRPMTVAVSDVDNDGLPDVISLNQDSPNGLLVFRATAERAFQAPPGFGATFSAGSVPAALALRDIDGDGIRDPLVADQVSDRAVLRLGRANVQIFSGTVAACPDAPCLSAGRTPVGIAAADFDGNGTYDLLTVNRGGGNVALAVNLLDSSVVRGDGNGDGQVSVADSIAVMRALAGGGNGRAVEDAVREGLASNVGADADGDGTLTTSDAIGVAGHLFGG